MDDDICVGVGDTYKSHFARSVAVSSHQVQRFGKDEGHLEVGRCDVDEKNFLGEPEEEETSFALPHKLYPSTRVPIKNTTKSEINKPDVECFLYRTHINTLRWQLAQIEASRDMYRALMKQVVNFLEKTYKNLETMGGQLDASRGGNDVYEEDQASNHYELLSDCESVQDIYRWKTSKKHNESTQSTEKLSQEAYRLLRTAKSLLNTTEPDLAQAKSKPDQEINIQQLFDAVALKSDHVQPSKLEGTARVSKMLCRKLSLPLSATSARKTSPKTARNCCILSSTLGEKSPSSSRINVHRCEKSRYELERSSTVNCNESAEEESGFSSLNSFQEVGVPHFNSATINDGKEGCRKSSNFYWKSQEGDRSTKHDKSEMNVWHVPSASSLHRRSNSVSGEIVIKDKSLNVLWV